MEETDNTHIWGSLFFEAIVDKVVINTTQKLGRLAVAPALCNLFQVCLFWRLVSESGIFWKNQTSTVWNRKHGHCKKWSWYDEYIYCHRTMYNFYINRYNYIAIPILPLENNNQDNSIICMRLALSDQYIAAGFSDGTVHLYLKANTRERFAIFYHEERDRLAEFPNAVTGIILFRNQLVFASLVGDVRVVILDPSNPHLAPPSRLAHHGDIISDGSLVDFAGCMPLWVGLYAGVLGHAFCIWNGKTEQILFKGGTLKGLEPLQGWRLLTPISNSVGRVMVVGNGMAIACTAHNVVMFDLRKPGEILYEHDFLDALMLKCVSSINPASLMFVHASGLACILDAMNHADYIFRVRDEQDKQGEQVVGCVNNDYVMIYEPTEDSVIKIWKKNGRFLNRLRERLDGVTALAATDTYVVASSCTTLHVFDFVPAN